VADDRGVGQQHQRLGDERDECRRGDRQDAPIEVVEASHSRPRGLWILLWRVHVDLSPADLVTA
jgi:hypothetical protein